MTNETIERDVHRLGASLQRLGEALAEPESSSRCTEDTAQAFVYTMDLFWKVCKELLVSRGEDVHMPREAVRCAHEREWLDNPDQWIEMLKDEYELAGGSYTPGTARRLYPHIKGYFTELCRAHALMAARLLEQTTQVT